jgi:Fe-S-cluster-containing hydrogenase component 2/CRP-like cAMP-binding protein
MPPAELPRYETDIDLSDELFDRLFVAARLGAKSNITRFPGSLRLRRYRPGDVICRLGEEGFTAFYLLTNEVVADLLHFAQERADKAPEDETARLLAGLKRDLVPRRSAEAGQAAAAFAARTSRAKPDSAAWYQQMKDASPAKKRQVADGLRRSDPALAGLLLDLAEAEDGKRVAATANLPVARPAQRRASGLWGRLRRALGGGTKTTGTRPARILNDGPTDIDADSREASMCEGDLFGEMSCLNRTPRSATVVAVADCYVLEMLRNLLDALRRDKVYKERLQKVVGERLVNSYLLESPIFAGLDEATLDRLRGQMELVEYEAGTLIYDENDRADCMHLIVSGIAKVLANVSWLWKADDVPDWRALCADLVEGGRAPGLGGTVWEALPAPVRQAVEKGTGATTHSADDRRLIVDALNDFLKDPSLHEKDELQDLLRAEKLGQEVWRLLAHPRQDSAEEMRRCNRLLLESLLPPGVFAGEGVANWKVLAEKLGGETVKTGDLKGAALRTLGRLLPDEARAALGPSPDSAPQKKVLAGLDGLLTSQPWLLLADVSACVQADEILAGKVQQFLPQKAQRRELWTPFAFDRFSRALHRLLLEAVYPRSLGKSRRPAGAPTVLGYRARGEFIGEMGLLSRDPRSATCVAYNHPDNDPRREVGPIRLIRIGRELFDQLRAEVPGFDAQARKAAEERRANSQRAQTAAAEDLARSGRAEELGLIEGQRLMLIDLDRCTRCDECVQACVATHDDGRSRLFLDGPRLDRFLVPTTCRSCLDPVCLIGCPVGSIRRGDDKQILIEDWCIGCRQCAKQCPYGSIQMHDIGLIPEGAPGWRYQPAASVQDADWHRPGYRASRWPSGRPPFRYNPVFRATLPGGAAEALLFRYEFRLGSEVPRSGSQFQITVVSTKDALPAAAVWLNGRELPGRDKVNRGGSDDPLNYHSREFPLPEGEPLLRSGVNVLAVRVGTPANGEDIFFDARLDEEKQAAKGALQKVVTLRAVVCDLCGNLPNGPACVRACPHDAAMRVNASAGLPKR